jgi:hypothetical protein
MHPFVTLFLLSMLFLASCLTPGRTLKSLVQRPTISLSRNLNDNIGNPRTVPDSLKPVWRRSRTMEYDWLQANRRPLPPTQSHPLSNLKSCRSAHPASSLAICSKHARARTGRRSCSYSRSIFFCPSGMQQTRLDAPTLSLSAVPSSNHTALLFRHPRFTFHYSWA